MSESRLERPRALVRPAGSAVPAGRARALAWEHARPHPAGSCAGRACGGDCGRGDGCRGAAGHLAGVRGARRLAPARRRARARRRRLVHGPGDRASSAGSTRAPARRARSPLGEGSAPHGVIVGPDGAPWITDGGLNAIVRVDPRTRRGQGATRCRPRRRDANLNTAVFDRAGMLWFTGQSGFYGRLDPGDRAACASGARPAARARTGSPPRRGGDVYYASLAGSHIARIDVETGRATRLEPPTRDQGARRVWSDSQGRIWVSEWNAGQLAVYDPAAQALARMEAARRRAAGLRRLRRRARHRLAHRLRRQRAASASTRRTERFTTLPAPDARRERAPAPRPRRARSGAPSPASTGSSSRGAADARPEREPGAIEAASSTRREYVPTARPPGTSGGLGTRTVSAMGLRLVTWRSARW